jgi:type VI secretion system protein
MGNGRAKERSMTNDRTGQSVPERLRVGARALLLAAWVAMSAGCAMPGFLSFKGERVKWKEVTLTAAADANGNSPIAIDVVLVTDEALQARLAELPASRWFAARADFASTYPNGLRVRSWELVPGQRVAVPGASFEGPRVATAFVFVNYPEPGAHRARIEQFSGTLAVQLDNTAFHVAVTQ